MSLSKFALASSLVLLCSLQLVEISFCPVSANFLMMAQSGVSSNSFSRYGGELSAERRCPSLAQDRGGRSFSFAVSDFLWLQPKLESESLQWNFAVELWKFENSPWKYRDLKSHFQNLGFDLLEI